MDTILEIIEKIQKQKTKAKKEPNHVTGKEIRKEFAAQLEVELQLLIEDGKITKGDTINDKYYRIVEASLKNEQQMLFANEKALY